jgi:hypothetical protein
MLYYVPLESYKERYTMQWSAPETGWLERNWRKYGVEYMRIEGLFFVPDTAIWAPPNTIKTGMVLDAVGRSRFCFNQISALLGLAEVGAIKDTDVIFFDDFWTPGIEALPYAFTMLGVKPRTYAFLHAQSVDEYDFTHPMRSWMRHFEKGIGEWLTGIFTSCPTLKDLIVQGGIAPAHKVQATGHPFCSEEVIERMPAVYRMMITGKDVNGKEFKNSAGEPISLPRKNQIVWSSRWDWEKDPLFFLRVVDEVLAHYDCPKDTKFVVCTSAKQLRSNDSHLIDAARTAEIEHPGRFEVKENLSKEEYYAVLCESKIQFNCALQDFVPITLQEASVAGCWPVYPYFRAMPESLLWDSRFLYVHKDEEDATRKILHVLNREDDLWSPANIRERSWIHSRFDVAWLRMVRVMGLSWYNVPTDTMFAAQKDPFARPVVAHHARPG